MLALSTRQSNDAIKQLQENKFYRFKYLNVRTILTVSSKSYKITRELSTNYCDQVQLRQAKSFENFRSEFRILY